MNSSLFDPNLFVIKGLAIIDNSNNTILSKFYDKSLFSGSLKEQREFEKKLFNKTHRTDSDVVLIDSFLCVYKSNLDVYFYVIGSAYENELILLSVLNCFYDSISSALRRSVERKHLLESLDTVLLAFDEICDQGVILDCDPTSVVSRIGIKSDDLPIGEQTISQVFQTAKEQIKWSILK